LISLQEQTAGISESEWDWFSMVTLVATKGDLNRAGLAAAAEGIVTSNPKDLATGGTAARAAKAIDFMQNVHRVEGAITGAVRDWIHPVSVY
jgi:hypothetical protein